MIRVLIVEDDFRVAEINAAFVSQDPNFEVLGTAHSAALGYEMITDLKPDLVLLDLYLPDEHGLELFAKIQQLPRLNKILAKLLLSRRRLHQSVITIPIMAV